MALVSVDEKTVGTMADEDEDKGQVTRVFQVEMGVVTDEALDVIGAAGIPSIGDAHDDDATYWAEKKVANLVGNSRTLWVVVVTYTNRAEPDSTYLYTWSNVKKKRVMETDKTSPTAKQVQNSAGYTFVPAPETVLYWPQVTCRGEFATWSLANQSAYIGTRNETAFTVDGQSVAAGEGLITGYTATKKLKGAATAYDVTLTILLDPGENVAGEGGNYPRVKHEIILLDAGLVNGNGERATDANYQPSQTPLPLDSGSGDFRTPGQLPYYLQFQPYAEATWESDAIIAALLTFPAT